MKKFLVAGVAVAAFCAAPALAADMPTKGPVSVYKAAPAPSISWTGCYSGVQAGYGWTKATIETAIAESADGNGGKFGGHLGCNFQNGLWVTGIEGDLEWANIKGHDAGDSGDTNQLKLRWQSSVRARLGYTWDKHLIYATGGWAWAGARSSVLDPGEQETIGKTISGWTVGAGWEYAFSHNLTGRIEYRYTDFGSNNFVHPFNGYTAIIGAKESVVRVGLTYKFGGDTWGKGPVNARY